MNDVLMIEMKENIISRFDDQICKRNKRARERNTDLLNARILAFRSIDNSLCFLFDLPLWFCVSAWLKQLNKKSLTDSILLTDFVSSLLGFFFLNSRIGKFQKPKQEKRHTKIVTKATMIIIRASSRVYTRHRGMNGIRTDLCLSASFAFFSFVWFSFYCRDFQFFSSLNFSRLLLVLSLVFTFAICFGSTSPVFVL